MSTRQYTKHIPISVYNEFQSRVSTFIEDKDTCSNVMAVFQDLFTVDTSSYSAYHRAYYERNRESLIKKKAERRKRLSENQGHSMSTESSVQVVVH